MLWHKRDGSLERRVAFLLLVSVSNLPVQNAMASERDAQAMNPSQAAIVVAATQGFGITPQGGAHRDDCPCHCVFPCAALHSPLVPSVVHDLLPRMIASPTTGEVPAPQPESQTMQPKVRPPIA